MAYEELIEHVQAEESEQDDPLMTSEQLREAVNLIEDFEREGHDDSYSERELSTVKALQAVLAAYELAALGPAPRVRITVRFSGDAPQWRDIHSSLMVLGANGLRLEVISSEGSVLVLEGNARDEDEAARQVRWRLGESSRYVQGTYTGNWRMSVHSCVGEFV